MKNKHRLLILTALAYYSFFLFGLTDNIKGPAIPALIEDLNLSYTGGSSLFLAAYIGFLTGVLTTGFIASRKDNRAALILASLAITAGAAGNALGAPLVLMLGTFFLIGFGLGSIEVGANGLVAALYPAESGKYLNLLAVFHGAGSMAAPFIAGMLLAGGTYWRNLYALVIPVAALQVFLLLLFKRPEGIGAPSGEAEKVRFSILIRRDVMLYALFLTLYVSAEVGIATWMVDYLIHARDYPVARGSIMLSAFFGCLMAGRLAGSILVERLGYRRMLILAVTAAMVCFGCGVLLPASFALLIPLTGFFFSIIFPTATADAARRSDAPRSAVFSVLFFCAGLGGLLGPYLVGIASDFLTIRGGFMVNLLFIALLLPPLLLLTSRRAASGSGPEAGERS